MLSAPVLYLSDDSVRNTQNETSRRADPFQHLFCFKESSFCLQLINTQMALKGQREVAEPKQPVTSNLKDRGAILLRAVRNLSD